MKLSSTVEANGKSTADDPPSSEFDTKPPKSPEPLEGEPEKESPAESRLTLSFVTVHS